MKRVLSEERIFSVLLGLLVVRLFVVAPVIAVHTLRDPLLIATGALILITGILAIRVPFALRVAWIALATLSAFIYTVEYRSGGNPTLRVISNVFDVLTSIAITAVVLARVNHAGIVTGHRIRGAVAAYLLLAVVFAQCYETVQILVPDAFHMVEALANRRGDDLLLYFSLVTLTTAGYGDISPVHPVARSLANLESLLGQLYPAILIARLVSLEIASRQDRA